MKRDIKFPITNGTLIYFNPSVISITKFNSFIKIKWLSIKMIILRMGNGLLKHRKH